MMGKKMLVILNPTAGKGKAAGFKSLIETRLAFAGVDFEIVLTAGVGHAAVLAQESASKGYGVVVAAGGDGTVNEVANGLYRAVEAGLEIPAMGHLAIGRGNDFASGADVPSRLEDGIACLLRDKRRSMDLGIVQGGDYPQGRCFCNGLGAGFDTIVGLEAARMRRVRGPIAYLFGALKTFVEFPAAPFVRLSWDMTVLEQRCIQINVMNGRRLGGRFWMAPEAKNDDGLLDLCVAGELTRAQMAGLLMRYTKGTQAGHPRIRTAQVPSVRLEAPEGGLVVHADGETICTNGRSLVIECIPGVIDMICDTGGE